mmetsp:Transcript_11016/g.24999  ORF Transcript_11016/g.24999 Transcript_11016/m.24999 type:complete len:311 (-) Transcript_11016:251-1183(-)
MHSEQGIRIVDKVVRRDAKFCEALLSSLGIKNDTAEVLLSRQGLEELCDMSHLKCLEALWVNNNRLKSIQGLDNNVQIKDLYASSNVIATLDGSLRHLKYLRILSLNRNKLADLDKVLAAISHLSSLEELDLSGNPVANELFYRERIIYTFPCLLVLDRHIVTPSERESARMHFEGKVSTNLSFMRRKPLWRNPPRQSIASLSILTKEMYREIEQRKREQLGGQADPATPEPRPATTHGGGFKHDTFKFKRFVAPNLSLMSQLELSLSSKAASKKRPEGISLDEEKWKLYQARKARQHTPAKLEECQLMI